MSWTNFVKAGLLIFLGVGLAGCPKEPIIDMDAAVEELREEAPEQYRSCLDRAVTKLPTGKIKVSEREKNELIVKLRKSELEFKRCGLGAERWYRGKIRAFANEYYRQF